MQSGSRLRVFLALLGFVWIGFAILARPWLHASSATAYSEGLGLGGALLGGLLFIGLNAASTWRSRRKITWRTRFPAAWVGTVVGIAAVRLSPAPKTFSSTPPSAFDFSGLYPEPAMYFDSPLSGGGFAVALFLQLGMFLIAASQHSYAETKPWSAGATIERWHWGKLALLWVGAAMGFLVTSTIAWELRGSLWAPFFWLIFAIYIGAVAVTTWRWLSARERR